ncbi:MAG: hypothetical protein M1815_004989 [Lichina confinis]|nr:MAG: hypothetical protein M1815_004989 [Lichina confinis]
MVSTASSVRGVDMLGGISRVWAEPGGPSPGPGIGEESSWSGQTVGSHLSVLSTWQLATFDRESKSETAEHDGGGEEEEEGEEEVPRSSEGQDEPGSAGQRQICEGQRSAEAATNC